MKLRIPDKFNRRAVRLNFDKLSRETWDYLFDHEKENDLTKCRTKGWGVKKAWYSVHALKAWLLLRGYYTEDDFNAEGWPIPTRRSVPNGLKVTTHVLA